MTHDKAKDRIDKLLKLAKNNPSEEEGKSALKKARALMAKHLIDESEFENIEEKIESVVSERLSEKYTMWWHRLLSATIAQAFRCKSTSKMEYVAGYSKRRRVSTLHGLPEDLEIALKIYEYAVDLIEYLSNEYFKKHRNGKRPYIIGYLSGLNEVLQKQDEEFSDETALVMCVPVVVNNYVEVLTKGKNAKSPSMSVKTPEAYCKGREQGLKFKMDHELIGND